MKRYHILITGLMVFLFTATAWADDYPTYAGRKLGRGVTNVLLGWTEILRSEERVSDQHGPVAALFWGPLDGIGNAIKRTAVGVYETATFPMKTSTNADPILEPEFGAVNHDRAGYRPKDYSF